MAARDGQEERNGLVLPNSVTRQSSLSVELCVEITQDGDGACRHA